MMSPGTWQVRFSNGLDVLEGDALVLDKKH